MRFNDEIEEKLNVREEYARGINAGLEAARTFGNVNGDTNNAYLLGLAKASLVMAYGFSYSSVNGVAPTEADQAETWSNAVLAALALTFKLEKGIQ
jgi:hypothetical protein